jgi:GDPmannose 4,6-dehydratase
MARKKSALIIGVSSQDGSYLADLLLEKKYQVIGTVRRTTSFEKENLSHLKDKIIIEPADLIDSESLNRVVKKYQPDEIYNIAAQSIPADSWSHPIYTGKSLPRVS